MSPDRPRLGVAMIGHAFMGAAHSQAWRVADRFFDLPVEPVMRVLCGRDATRAREAVSRLAWEESSDDWRTVIARSDVDVVDICTPGDSHAEIAVAALAAGKHVICEKPLANTVAEAEQMTAAAEDASGRGVVAMVGFTYRRVPAVALARQLVTQGRLGEIRHVRAQYLQDWIADPEAPLSWRLQKERAGSGALGDIGAHIIDLTQHITGMHIAEVSGRLSTFVTERPLASEHTGLSGTASSDRGPVTVDDAAIFIARFDGGSAEGALGVFEATRFASGRKNAIRLEINGSAGSLAFDFEDMNVLQFFDALEPDETAGFRRILVTEPAHPYMAAWWPAGHGLGYEHAFTHQVVDFVRALSAGEQPSPSFADGLQVQRVLEAVETSSRNRAWETIPDWLPEPLPTRLTTGVLT